MEKMTVEFKIKDTPSPEMRVSIETLLAQKLKATIARDKSKEKKGRWILKVKKPEKITLESIESVVKKAGAKKCLRDFAITEGGDEEE